MVFRRLTLAMGRGRGWLRAWLSGLCARAHGLLSHWLFCFCTCTAFAHEAMQWHYVVRSIGPVVLLLEACVLRARP